MTLSIRVMVGRAWSWVTLAFGTHRREILLVAAFFSVALLSFFAGHIEASRTVPSTLSVTVVPPAEPGKEVSAPVPIAEPAPVAGVARIASRTDGCTFVGSRNSDKYHLPSCAVVKRIKPENMVCFGSVEEATKRGYVAGCIR